MIYDVVIVGGGPAGLSAALLLGRSCRRVLVIDAGRPRNAAARELHGFLSRDGATPQELKRLGRTEVAKYGVEIIDDSATTAECVCRSSQHPFKTGFQLKTRGGKAFTCRKLLFATGLCDEIPDFPGVRECYGNSVHHCPYCDGWEHHGEHLLAYGKGAKEAAGLGLSLRGWSEHVTVLTDGDALHMDDKKDLDRNQVDYSEESIVRFVHSDGKLQGVELKQGGIVSATAMFFNTARNAHCNLPRSLGCEFDDDGTACTSGKQKTNLPGLYLAGDADGDVQFVIVAAAEGATAAVAINRELQDEDRGMEGPRASKSPSALARRA